MLDENEIYKEMYLQLFNSTAQVIELLQKAQLEVEELYIKKTEGKIISFEEKNKK